MVDDPFKIHPNLIGKWYVHGSILVPAYGITHGNHVVNKDYLEASEEEFVVGTGQLTHTFTGSNGRTGAVYVETNADRYGDGTRRLIRKSTQSQAADNWQWEEILNGDGEVTGVALRDGFHLGVTYRLVYGPVFTDPGVFPMLHI